MITKGNNNIPFRSPRLSRRFEYQNIDPLVGWLISKNLATLKEIEEYYSLEDLYKIWESYIVPSYNEYLDIEQNKFYNELRRSGR